MRREGGATHGVFSGLRKLWLIAARMVGPHGADSARGFSGERVPAPWVQSRLFNTCRMKQRIDTAPRERPYDILTELARRGDTRTWEAGMTVVSEGEVADCMYIIHAGELRAVVAGDGGRQVELNTLVAGEFFGELMLSGALRAATVQVTVHAQLTRVSRAEVDQVLSARPDLALQMIHRLVQRVRTLALTVGRLASVDVTGAVTRSQRFGSAANVSIHIPCLQPQGVRRYGTEGTREAVEVPAPMKRCHRCCTGSSPARRSRSALGGCWSKKMA